MFRGYGVALTVTELGGGSAESGLLPPGVVSRPSRLTELLPVAERSAEEKAIELGRIQRFRAMLDAYEAAVVVGFAADRPDALDLPPGTPGAAAVSVNPDSRSPIPGTSEFFVDELALVTNSSPRAAGRLASWSHLLLSRLPAVWAAMADGELDTPRARVFVDVLGPTADGVPEQVVPRVLPEAAELSTGRLRARLLREVLAVDATAAERRRAQAERCADVRLYPTGVGMSEMVTAWPAPVAAACWTTVDELAWIRKHAGDPRPIGELRSVTHAELLLRPWDTTRPPVTAQLTVTAPLPSLRPADDVSAVQEPGEVNGTPITAAHVRQLLTDLDALCPGGLQPPTGGTLTLAVTDERGALLATTTRPELERLAARGCPHHANDCDCAVLDRPPPVDRYRPSAGQRRFGKTRDRSCRQPGCCQPVGRVDLDHVRPHGAGGPTDCTNLCCLCRWHHRLKTQAPGWRFVLTPDGVLRVTTPSGITRATRPPGLKARVEQRALPAPPEPPPEPEEPAPF